MIKQAYKVLKKFFNSSLIKSSGIYTLSNGISAAIPILLLPILTSELSPQDYGIISMFQIAVGIIYPFIGINLEGAVARKYYDKKCTNFSSFVGTSIFIFIICLIFVAIVLLIIPNFLTDITKLPRVWHKYLLFVASFQFIITLTFTIFQVSVKPIKYAFFQIAQGISNFILTFFFILCLNQNWEGRLNALFFNGLIFAVIGVMILNKDKLIKIDIKKSDVKYALAFGLPIIPHALGGYFFTAIDRFFLTHLVGLNETGNYTVAFQLASLITLITISFNNAFVPWLFENLNKNSSQIKKNIVKLTYIYFIALFVFAIIMIVILPSITDLLVGKSYTHINRYSIIIFFGFVFQGMYLMFTNYIAYANKTYIQGILTLSIGILKIPITYYLIKNFGSIGAPISFSLTFLIFFISTWVLSNHVFKMPWFKFRNQNDL